MKKILVANRGEIALRIMRSAREMGIKTVAVYSEADRNAPHVRYADEAMLIGPPASALSYLNEKKILAVCKELKVDAIHPGYGFLSENASFARKAVRAGITFIGPSARSIEIMGNKLAAKQAVSKYDIPMVPGTDKAVKSIAVAKRKGKEIGYPVLIKAAAGGGGKGMRVVKKEKELEEQMKMAISEATSAFGDGSVFIERYVTSPRHIEIQVLADSHGNTIHLFERECSIQRRHQKVVEEAPSTVLTPALREAMGKSAVEVAKSCKYVGAGTVEFLFDGQQYYFLEMNTRLQVEHPVTEMITGLDLVKEQINIARGKKLSVKQEELKINGHALEVRIYAEDPENNFLPDVGNLSVYRRPGGIGVRVDDGYEQGMDIPIYYDPMISKLIVHGKDRKTAIARMIRAIDEYTIAGVKTTLSFCRFVLEHKAFASGNFDTHFVSSHFDTREKKSSGTDKEERLLAAALAALLVSENKSSKKIKPSASGGKSKWRYNRAVEQ